MIIGLWIGEGGGQPLWDRRGGDLTGYGKDSNNRLIGLVYLVGGAQHHPPLPTRHSLPNHAPKKARLAFKAGRQLSRWDTVECGIGLPVLHLVDAGD